MSEQTSKHGPRLDDVEQDEPQEVPQDVYPDDRRGTPEGMSQEDVDDRAEIAQALGTSAFPGDRDALTATAAQNLASDRVLGRLGSLPPGETFENMQDVARHLGLHVETHRF